MLRVKLKLHDNFEVADDVIKKFEENAIESREGETFLDVLKSSEPNQFLALDPEAKKLFTMLPFLYKDVPYTSKFPDIVYVLFDAAIKNYNLTQEMFSFLQRKPGKNGDVNFISENQYVILLQSLLSTILNLHLSIEAAINSSIPEEYLYRVSEKNNAGQKFYERVTIYDKLNIELGLSFKDKIKNVLKEILQIDIPEQYNKLYNKMLELNSFRNDLVHLKSQKVENVPSYMKIIQKLFKVNILEYIELSAEFINLIRPGTIMFENELTEDR